MSTSGSYDWSSTAAQLISAAAEHLNIIPAGGTVSTNDSNTMLRTLNGIVKQWSGNTDMAQGLKVWTRQRVTLFLAKGQQTYTIGPATTDSRSTTQYGRTTLSAAAAANATTLTIASNTDTTTYPGTTVTMTSGDFIGIVLTDGTMHWTTISGTPTTTATIVSGLASAAASGNYVYWFTSRAQRFPDWESIALRNSDGIDTPMRYYVQVRDYEALSQKGASGDPTAALIEPLRLNTRITLNTQPSDVTKQIRLTVIYPAEDYDLTTNDIAFPQEWIPALEWETAFRSAPDMQRPWTPEMDKVYNSVMGMARQLNPQNSSAYYQPGRD